MCLIISTVIYVLNKTDKIAEKRVTTSIIIKVSMLFVYDIYDFIRLLLLTKKNIESK